MSFLHIKLICNHAHIKKIIGRNYVKLFRRYLSSASEHSKYLCDVRLHNPGENNLTKYYISTPHTTHLLNEHIKKTGGQVRTRFPPEPNGLLHIGHAKAININFGYAAAKMGVCILRYDDTNPEMEEETFIQGIKDTIEWLGFEAFQVTYASDYFPQLYELAEKLINKNLAYVCHQPKGTSNEVISPWRDRPISESLIAFRDMKNRQYKESEATLRLKMTTDQQTIDPVAYRIKYTNHLRTKDDWCVYPTYDFAHCLCDSIENITHSLCSAEFSLRRSTYYWICNACEVYCPVQVEFGRLNFLYSLASKRKISTLIQEGIVKGWDDPRLHTLSALKRRGFPPESINAFCRNFGLRTENAYISPVHLEYFVRTELDKKACRLMAVLNPLKIVIRNFPSEESLEIEVPNVPYDHSRGFHSVSFDKEVWIEASDFNLNSEKGFRRLTPHQPVGLRYTRLVIYLKEVIYTSSGEVDYLEVDCKPVNEVAKPKAFIHWACEPVKAEVRFFESLFMNERPDDLKSVPGGFLSDINPQSLTVGEALIGKSSLNDFHPYQRFQFERTGYFSVDPDSNSDRLVFNRIIELKQDRGFSKG